MAKLFPKWDIETLCNEVEFHPTFSRQVQRPHSFRFHLYSPAFIKQKQLRSLNTQGTEPCFHAGPVPFLIRSPLTVNRSPFTAHRSPLNVTLPSRHRRGRCRRQRCCRRCRRAHRQALWWHCRSWQASRPCGPRPVPRANQRR